MFQFPQFPLPALCVQAGVTPHVGCRVSPFRHPRIKAQSAAPRGLSQPLTSFIGRRCQGIHHWLLVACGLSLLLEVTKRPARRQDVSLCELHVFDAFTPGGAKASDARARYSILKKRAKPLAAVLDCDDPSGPPQWSGNNRA